MYSLIDFLKIFQTDIMLALCGVCACLAVMVSITRTIPPKRKFALLVMELSAILLLLFDRQAYLYRGNTSRIGYWMVRISNFQVFTLNSFIIFTLNLYFIDLLKTDGKLRRTPRRLKLVTIISFTSIFLITLSQFNGFLYSFDEFNRYQRGKYFLIGYILPFCDFALLLWVIFQYYKTLRRRIRIPLVLFTILPFFAAVIQIFAYGFSLTNITLVSTIVILYIFSLLDLNDTVEHARHMEIEFLREEQKNAWIMFEQTSSALATAIDAKDKYTHGHSTRVAEYSKEIAKRMGKSSKECNEIYYAGLLHDIGKIGISGRIINKDGVLTDEEYKAIKMHPIIGSQILSSINKSPYLAIGAKYHHERYDGKGYPEGLKGENIPLVARIISVADSYDAMTSKRSYRTIMPQQKVRSEILHGSNSQFDPQIARIMLQMIDEDVSFKMKENDQQ